MKRLIILIFAIIPFLGMGQRAISGAITIDVGKIDTLYFTSDTLYLSEDGVLFKTAITAGGSDGYISNVTESGNSITFTGVGGAFNSSIGNIAKTNQVNSFSSTQYTGTSSSTRTEVGAAFINIRETNTQSLRFQNNLGTTNASIIHYEGTLFDIESDDDIKLRRGTREIRIESGGIEMDLDAATSSNVVYYDATTEELTYGAAGGFSGVQAYATANQSLTASSTTTINFGATNYDTDLYRSGSSFTVPSAGAYLVVFNGQYSPASSISGYAVHFRVNGSSRRIHQLLENTSSAHMISATETLYLSANDVITIGINCSGVVLSSVTTSTVRPEITIEKIY